MSTRHPSICLEKVVTASRCVCHTHVPSICTYMPSGGHYFPDMSPDPWLSTAGGPTYTSDLRGVARVSYTIGDFSLYDSRPVNGRALVVHGPQGTRMGCGVIGSASEVKMGIVSMGPYPGPTGRQGVGGTLAVRYHIHIRIHIHIHIRIHIHIHIHMHIRRRHPRSELRGGRVTGHNIPPPRYAP